MASDATNPEHYRRLPVESIDIIIKTLGEEGAASFCFGNVLKYRLRAGAKGDAAEDLAKADWYLAMYHHLAGDGPDPRGYLRKGDTLLEKLQAGMQDRLHTRTPDGWVNPAGKVVASPTADGDWEATPPGHSTSFYETEAEALQDYLEAADRGEAMWRGEDPPDVITRAFLSTYRGSAPDLLPKMVWQAQVKGVRIVPGSSMDHFDAVLGAKKVAWFHGDTGRCGWFDGEDWRVEGSWYWVATLERALAALD